MTIVTPTASRRHAARVLLATCTLGAGLLAVWGRSDHSGASSTLPSRERVLLLGSDDVPDFETRIDPVEQHAIGLALCDTGVAQRALRAPGWPAALRQWLIARARFAAGDTLAAAHALRGLSTPGSLDALAGEPPEVRWALARDRALFALAAGDTAAARVALQEPPEASGGDARWSACRGAWELADGRPLAAARTLDAAWAAADDAARRDVVFAQRALALLATGDSLAAARAWLDFAAGLRNPVERRAALATWDAHPGLRAAMDRPGVRLAAARWLARVVRREAALELARAAWRRGDARERADGFVEVAEQLYRLRRDADLEGHLRQPRPAGMNLEQRAALAAYPWGVARRQGASPRVARGFDDVAAQFAGTDRAGEALWEAAWMWELAGRLPTAEQRFVRYLQRYPQAPFADGAAMRSVWLPLWRGHPQVAWDRFRRYQGRLRGGVEAASALWAAARAAQAAGDSAAAEGLRERLRAEHAHSPFVEPPETWLRRGPATDPAAPTSDAPAASLAALWERQWTALQRVAAAVQHPEVATAAPASLAGVERMLQLGLFAEGERRLLAWPEARARDPVALVAAVAVAWRCGRPEAQARLATLLNDRLRLERPTLSADLDVLAFPTPYAGAVLRTARQLEVSPWLLWGLMRRESFFDAEAVSLAGARGLMQLMSATAATAAQARGEAPPSPAELLRPLTNVRLGGSILAGLLRRYAGNVFTALAAYNGGEANAERWTARLQEGDPPAQAIVLISYAETRQYVFQVLRHAGVYAASYGSPASPGLPTTSP